MLSLQYVINIKIIEIFYGVFFFAPSLICQISQFVSSSHMQLVSTLQLELTASFCPSYYTLVGLIPLWLSQIPVDLVSEPMHLYPHPYSHHYLQFSNPTQYLNLPCLPNLFPLENHSLSSTKSPITLSPDSSYYLPTLTETTVKNHPTMPMGFTLNSGLQISMSLQLHFFSRSALPHLKMTISQFPSLNLQKAIPPLLEDTPCNCIKAQETWREPRIFIKLQILEICKISKFPGDQF